MKNNFLDYILLNNILSTVDRTMILKIISALSEVILLIIVLIWLLKKIYGVKDNKTKSLINIKHKISIDPNKFIIILDLQTKKLVLGVTTEKITHLYTLSSSSEDLENQKKNMLKKNKSVF